MRYGPRIAVLSIAGVTLGAAMAMVVPTEMKVNRNSELERLSQPQIVNYPGQDQVIEGPNSYPVTYSPQWLAVRDKMDRERFAAWQTPIDPLPVRYDQPSRAQDEALVRTAAAQDAPEPAEPEADSEQLAEADAPST